MIASARTAYPHRHWIVGDIGEWVRQPIRSEPPIDLIFSGAALQWVEDHASVFPRLIAKLAPNGVLAVHMPAYDAVPNQTMREMAASPRWRQWFPDGHAREWQSHSLEFYNATLARCAKWLDLWATDYFQVMPDTGAIFGWYKSTGLRPYLDCITDAMAREDFLSEYRTRLMPSFPTSDSQGVPFVFRRIFIVAGV
jgi:trans-aconitate 2-methyltransferase